MEAEVTYLLDLHQRNASADVDTRWYAEARAQARRRSRELGVPLHRYLGVVAAMSPLTQWRTANAWPNLDAADRVFRGEGRGLKTSVARATRIVNGERPTTVLGTAKTANFYHNLIASTTDHVTIDTWMMRAMRQPRDTPSSQREYDRLSRAVRDAATLAGITPHALQASVWSQVKREAS